METRQKLLDHLENYLMYMGQMGFAGLALKGNPFSSEPAGAEPAPAAVPKQPFPKPAQTAEPKLPNLFSIMEIADHVSALDLNREKAQKVGGTGPVEVLRNLYKTFRACEACALGTTRNKFVFGEGPPDAELVFVGGAPDSVEDRQGRPFLGEPGEMLTRIIKAMGFDRKDVFITNVAKCHPPGRGPLSDEMATCSPILNRQLETLNPRIIVILGPEAFSYFRGPSASLMRERGQFFSWRRYQCLATFHPAYVLRNPRSKREVWEDMQKVMAELNRT